MKVSWFLILAGLMLVLSLPCMADDSTAFKPGNVVKAKIGGQEVEVAGGFCENTGVWGDPKVLVSRSYRDGGSGGYYTAYSCAPGYVRVMMGTSSPILQNKNFGCIKCTK
ncbi:hypothetical protein [Pseudodesulfovibrio tunisiensis]|uniref:hypothetical protein n=1 Tax=Pseudodesulfovibrio tunisiensis TaxID=463192 RepID=UPI001FB38CD3|nr:hypothetical protein [Pseudodesulfovibrio tunisiensis]